MRRMTFPRTVALVFLFTGLLASAIVFAADTLTPSSVNLVLGPGQTATIGKTLHLDPAPAKADIVIAIDTTGSMSAAIADAKAQANQIVNDVQALIPGARFAVVDYEDYPIGPFGGSSDVPYQLLTPMGFTANPADVQAAIDTMAADGGGDGPEAVNRVLFESFADPALNYDPEAVKFLLLLGDAPPHDANLATDFPACLVDTPPTDPGRDGQPGGGDDLGTADVLAGMLGNNVKLLIINFGGFPLPCWEAFAAVTGGAAVDSTAGGSLADVIVDLVTAAAAHIDQVDLVVAPAGFSSWVSFNPVPPYGPLDAPIDVTFDEQITVPIGTGPGTYQFTVTAVADGAVRATQQVTVVVPSLTIGDITVTEGDSGTTPANFTLSLSPASTQPVTVTFSTADGSAIQEDDYIAGSGPIVFDPGQTAVVLSVPVIGDAVDEPDEQFLVLLSGAVGAAITDDTGTGTILDDDRNGVFSCRASVLNLAGIQPVIANAFDTPCQDDHRTLAEIGLSAGLLRLRVTALDALTDQTPDDLESAPPSPGDTGTAQALVDSVTISTLGLRIALEMIQSTASAQCVAGPEGLTPQFSGSSSIAGLSINGLPITVGSAPLSIPLVIGTLHLNQTVTTGSSVTQRAVFLDTLLADVIIAESKANFEGTGTHPSGNPCQQ